jgi:hypothetical protein
MFIFKALVVLNVSKLFGTFCLDIVGTMARVLGGKMLLQLLFPSYKAKDDILQPFNVNQVALE